MVFSRQKCCFPIVLRNVLLGVLHPLIPLWPGCSLGILYSHPLDSSLCLYRRMHVLIPTSHLSLSQFTSQLQQTTFSVAY